MTSPCLGCIYYKVCGSSTRQEICHGRQTKSEKKRESLYEHTRNQVYATGNKWAIENFHATHD